MIIQEFFDKYNGKGIDFDGFYGFQCMDLYQQYNKEVIGGPHIPANAYDVWNHYPKNLYERIENNPNNFPLKGDVIIWNNNVGGGYGHIAVCSIADVNGFVSFDQNWPVGTICHFQNHVYNNVIGWLKPKSDIIPPMVFNDQTVIPKELLEEDQDLEIQQIRGLLKDGKRDNLDLVNCRKENEELKYKLQTALNTPKTVQELTRRQLLWLFFKSLFK